MRVALTESLLSPRALSSVSSVSGDCPPSGLRPVLLCRPWSHGSALADLPGCSWPERSVGGQ